MTINYVFIKLLGKIVKLKEEIVSPTHQARSKRPIIKQRQNKGYSFLDLNAYDMFDHLLEVNLIELPKDKRPPKMNRCEDLNYCKYPCLVSYLIEKCFVFKDKIITLANQGAITFIDDSVVFYIVSSVYDSFDEPNIKVKHDSIPITNINAIHPLPR